MKKILLVAVFAVVLLAPVASADNSTGFGLGIMVGEPTGVSGKIWLSGTTSLNMGAAWSLDDNSGFQGQLDYVWHNFGIFNVSKGKLALYYGIGGRFKIWENSDDSVGARIPVGLDYLFENSRFDMFFEIVPILDLTPSTEFDLNGALGGRFFF